MKIGLHFAFFFFAFTRIFPPWSKADTFARRDQKPTNLVYELARISIWKSQIKEDNPEAHSKVYFPRYEIEILAKKSLTIFTKSYNLDI